MPLLWFRIASEGSPPERYTLQLPFQLGPSHSLTPADVKHVQCGKLRLELAENQGIHLLRAVGFGTSEEAELFLPRLRGALLRLIVIRKLSLRAPGEMQQIKLKEPPVDVRANPTFGGMLEEKGWTHLDGSVDPSPAVVIPEHLRILEIGTGSASLTHGMPIPSFLKHVAEGLALPQPEGIAADERLSLSIDLYAASLWETSQRARVISLATSLEALIEPTRVDEISSRHVDRLVEAFESARDRSSEDAEQRRTLDSLRSRVAGLKEESISANLRRLAADHASVLGESVDDAKRNMSSAYGVRSKLLHDGQAPSQDIASAADWLAKAVPAILGSLVSDTAKVQQRPRES